MQCRRRGCSRGVHKQCWNPWGKKEEEKQEVMSSHKIELISTMQRYTMQISILTELSTAFGNVTFPNVIWLCKLQPKTATDL